MDSIILEIFRETALTENEMLHIGSKFQKVILEKGDFLLRADEKVNDIYFIQNGCLRTYFIDSSGKEYTLQFAIKGWWTSDYIALFGKNKRKSVSYIECIKNSVLYKISKEDLDILCIEIPKVAQHYTKNLESAFAAFQKRILDNIVLSAKERYLSFTEMYPIIEQNIKNYHIASYLGITTESLSRIRKEITNI